MFNNIIMAVKKEKQQIKYKKNTNLPALELELKST